MVEDIRREHELSKNNKKKVNLRHLFSIKPHLLSPKLKQILKSLGPGIITGASDDDPSGIATFSQAGAKFGFGMLWLVLFQYPIMTVIQEMCARIGLVTGGGLAAVIKKKYSKKIVFPIVSLLFIANTINIGADIGAMSASVRLIFPQIPFIVAIISFAAFILAAEIRVPYKNYVKILKYLTLSLFAYFITAIIVGGNLNEIIVATIVPHIEFTPEFAMMFVAIFGTSISPYLFFWQASEEAEEDVAKHKIKEISSGDRDKANIPHVSQKEVKVMRSDIAIGIEPLVKSFPNAGQISEVVFALGIIGTGLLAVPVLAGSAGYALADGFGWKQGLYKKFKNAKAFYVTISAATLIGLCINFINIDPIKALVYAAVINAVVAVPILISIMKIANDKKIMQSKANGRISNVIGWITILIMGVSVMIMFLTWAK